MCAGFMEDSSKEKKIGSKGSTKELCRNYRYQDEDAPHDHSLPRLTHEVRGPELVHVSEKNLSQIENVHGYVLQSHISPLKVSYIALPTL